MAQLRLSARGGAVRYGALLACMVLLAACGSGTSTTATDGSTGAAATVAPEKLTIYSGRSEKKVGKLYENFERDTGIPVEVRYAGSAELAAQIQEEGTRTPADVFYAQDAGAIGAVAPQLTKLPDELVSKVPARYRATDGRWLGVTGRVRTLAYNSEQTEPDDLPVSVYELTEPKYRGKVGVAPTNASFQGFVTAMRIADGDEKARRWLEGLAANDPQVYEGNSGIVKAIAAGEVQYGLVNHYYLYELLGEDADAPVKNHFFPGTDPGTFVNISAIGIPTVSDQPQLALRFVQYALGEGQNFFADESKEREYPLAGAAGSTRDEELPPLASFRGPNVALSTLGDELEETVRMIEESGLASP